MCALVTGMQTCALPIFPLESDPPLHSAYRTFLNPVFSPKVTNRLDAKIREYARGYVEGFRAKGKIDFLQEFAFEFPIKVFLELMGLPPAQVKQFLARSEERRVGNECFITCRFRGSPYH